jgi:hypothetical protein
MNLKQKILQSHAEGNDAFNDEDPAQTGSTLEAQHMIRDWFVKTCFRKIEGNMLLINF